jgi:hypothetical protein
MRPAIFPKIGLLLALSFLLSGCTIPFFGKAKQAALQVTSTPKATVFLDGEHIGTTPFYDEKLKPGDYTIKLTPDDPEAIPWESKIHLAGGILTVVSRELASNPDQTSGYTLSLEPAADKKSVSLAVVSTPDGAVVSLDSEPKGFSPISLDNLTAGEHLLTISSPGYVEKSLKPRLVEGHKVTATVQLAKLPEEAQAEPEATESADLKPQDETSTPTPKPTAKPTPKPTPKSTSDKSATGSASLEGSQVKILDTPTGWLNVRSEPSTTGGDETIVAKVDPGETFPYIKSSGSGWYQIELDNGELGWVVSKYAQLVE